MAGLSQSPPGASTTCAKSRHTVADGLARARPIRFVLTIAAAIAHIRLGSRATADSPELLRLVPSLRDEATPSDVARAAATTSRDIAPRFGVSSPAEMSADDQKAPAPALNDRALNDRERRELFATIYREQFEHVFRTLRRLGVPERDIEDAIHDVFIVVHRRLIDFDVARSARPWVTGIAYRVASDDRRRAHRRRETPSDELEGSSSLDVGDAGGFGNARQPTDEALDAARDRKRVQDALVALPMDQRVVLVMHDLDGFAMPEIAAELAIPLNTAYSRLRLARNKFEAAIRSQEPHRGVTVGPAPLGRSAGRDAVDVPQDGGPARASTRKTHGS